MARTEDSLLSPSFSSSTVFSRSFLAAFITCYRPVASNTSPLSSPLQPLVYVEYEGWNIFSLRAVKWHPAVALEYITVHFSEGERVISLPFGFALQLFARFWNISGDFM